MSVVRSILARYADILFVKNHGGLQAWWDCSSSPVSILVDLLWCLNGVLCPTVHLLETKEI